jgi:hypothetical protein
MPGDKPPEPLKEHLQAARDSAASRQYDDVFKELSKAGQQQNGTAEALRQGVIDFLPRLDYEWANRNKAKIDTNNDGKLSLDEINERLKTKGGFKPSPEDELFLNDIKKRIEASGGTSIGLKDLETAANQADRKQLASALGKLFPNAEAVKLADTDGDDKITKDEIRKLAGSEVFKNNATAEQKSAMAMLQDDNLNKALMGGKDYFTSADMARFISRETGQASPEGTAGEVIHNAFTANNNALFRDISGAKPDAKDDDLRVSHEQIAEVRKRAESEAGKDPKDKGKANAAEFYKYVDEHFADISSDGKNLSLADVKAYRDKATFPDQMREIFGDAFKEGGSGVTKDDITKKKQEYEQDAKRLALLAGANPTDGKLKEQIADNSQKLAALDLAEKKFDQFSKVDFVGKPGEVPPAPVPNDDKKIENVDLNNLNHNNGDTLAYLNRTEKTGTTPGDSSTKVSSSIEMFKDAPVHKIDGKEHPEWKFKHPNDKEYAAVMDYGHLKLGYHWTKQADGSERLDTIVTNPDSDKPRVYQRDDKGQWWYRPNGMDKTEGQVAMQGQLDVNDKTGQFYHMLSGQIDEKTHQPAANSAYRTLFAENEHRVVDQVMRGDGSAAAFVRVDNKAEPTEFWSRAAGQNGEKLVFTHPGNDANVWAAKVKDPSGAERPIVLANVNFANNGTLQYDAYGHHRVVSTDGYQLDEYQQAHIFDSSGRYVGINWRNGNSVYFSHKDGSPNQIDYFVSQRQDGSRITQTVYERTGDSRNGVPIWNAFTNLGNGQRQALGQVAFNPHLDPDGHLTDSGRTNTPGAGSVFDWDRNGFVTADYRRQQIAELGIRV